MARRNALSLSRESQRGVSRDVATRNACAACGIIRVAGSCGCNGGSSLPRPGDPFFTPNPGPMLPPTGIPQPVPLVRDSGWLGCCEFKAFDRAVNVTRLRQALMQQFGDRRTPYMDVQRDCMDLDVIYSERFAGAAGGGEQEIEITPTRGSFLALYYTIAVWTTATGVATPLWTHERPRVDECPVPCDDLDNEIQGVFSQKVEEACCCGVPFLAYLQRSSEDAPLVVPITIPELATGQIQLRGFCCSTRLC